MTSDTLAHLLAQMWPDGSNTPLRSESDVRVALAAYLRAHKWEVVERVRCVAGEADLVVRQGSRTGVIEIKLALTRRALHEAASQVLAYRMAIDLTAEAIVVGYSRPGTETALAGVKTLGVKVIALRGEVRKVAKAANTSAVTSLPSPLTWNVQPFAHSRGVTTVAELVQATGLPKQSLYGVWKGETSQISVAVLGRLCVGLNARPGDWFVWEGEGEERRLAWNVAVVAGHLGLAAPQLAFRAGMYYRMIQLYWQGAAQSVFIQTLGKLAQALSAEEQPFDIGDLFTWRTEPVTAEPNSVGPRADV